MTDNWNESPDTWWICATCAVEHADRVEVCRICADERQWVPPAGQRWTTRQELAESGQRVQIAELEPALFAITGVPGVGIGQHSKLVCTPAGNLLWDPIGYLDNDAVEQVRQLGDVVAIAASHPHMFGAQVQWSRALGGPPVLVSGADLTWVARPDPVIRPWSGEVQVVPDLALNQIGGHFPGSSLAHWSGGADGRGVLLSSDTIYANPDRQSVSFMRSFPNHIPLSGAVVERIVARVERLRFDRLYGNFGFVIDANAATVIRRSADRHIGWARGDFDHLT